MDYLLLVNLGKALYLHAEKNDPKSGTAGMSTFRILVVDDDPNLLELLSVTMGSHGYEVQSATNGESALLELRKNRFDLLVLDIMMPVMDGWELMKIVKDDPELDRVKVILLTAKNTDKDEMIGRRIFKADEFLTKPFDLQTFLHMVERLADGSSH